MNRSTMRDFTPAAIFPRPARVCVNTTEKRHVWPRRRLIGLSRRRGSEKITHLIVTSCTGFAAPGVDFEIIRLCNLEYSIERTVIGFMGCNAGHQRAQARAAYCSLGAQLQGFDCERRTLHASPPRVGAHRTTSVIPVVRRWVRGGDCERRPSWFLARTLSTPNSRKTLRTRSPGTSAILASTWSSQARCPQRSPTRSEKGRNVSSPDDEQSVSDVGDSSRRSDRARRS